MATASSNTPFNPSCVKAEHSLYVERFRFETRASASPDDIGFFFLFCKSVNVYLQRLKVQRLYKVTFKLLLIIFQICLSSNQQNVCSFIKISYFRNPFGLVKYQINVMSLNKWTNNTFYHLNIFKWGRDNNTEANYEHICFRINYWSPPAQNDKYFNLKQNNCQ